MSNRICTALVLLLLPACTPQKAPEPVEGAAPLWTLPRIDGSGDVSLASLRGNYVVQAFWATWCVPARSTQEGVLSLLHSLFGHGRVEIVSIGITAWTGLESMQKEARFARELGFDWTMVYDRDGEAFRGYDIQVIPTINLIDPEGRLVLQGDPIDAVPKIFEILSKEVRLTDAQRAYLDVGRAFAVAGYEYFTNQTSNDEAVRIAEKFLAGTGGTPEQRMIARQFLCVVLGFAGEGKKALKVAGTGPSVRMLYARAHALGHGTDTRAYLKALRELEAASPFFAHRVGWELWRVYDVTVEKVREEMPRSAKPDSWVWMESRILLMLEVFPAWAGMHYHAAYFYSCRAQRSKEEDAAHMRERAADHLERGIELSRSNIWEFRRQIDPDLIGVHQDWE